MSPPIQLDPARPVRTYDSTGKVVSTNTNEAAPIKNVDSVGRKIEDSALKATADLQKSIKSEAQSVAEKAASTLPNFADKKEDKLSPPEDQVAEDKEKITDAKVRKEYLEAQRIKREAQEMQKKAKTNLDKSVAFEKAVAMAENGEDPTAILKAAGLDPVKFYRNMTNYALSDKGKKEETDPVKKELAEHKEKLEKYEKHLEEQEKAIKEREDTAAHNEVIKTTVIPLLQNNANDYEVLLTHYGNQAAVEVYKNVWSIYQETGETRTFKDVADEMEKYWSEQVETGINNAYKLSKFKNRFTQSDNDLQRETTSERHEKPNSSVTLSNKQQISTSSSVKSNPYKGMTKEEKVAAILKKFE